MDAQRLGREDRLDSLFRLERQYGNIAKWLLLVIGLVSLYLWREFQLVPLDRWSLEIWVTLSYLLTNGLLTIAFVSPERLARRGLWAPSARTQHALILLSFVLDYAFVTALVGLTGGAQSDLYLLYGFLTLKASVYYPYTRDLIVISFSSFALWIAASYVGAGSLYFLADRGFLMRYIALFIWILGCLVIGWVMERRERAISALDVTLSRKSEALDDQGHVVQNTANDLANRLLELRSLQESVKAINSALTLDELLQLIVDNATQVLRGARCSIALVDEKRSQVVTAAAAGIPREQLWGTAFRIGEGVAGWVVENHKPVLIGAVTKDPRFQRVGDWPVASLMSVPLFSEGDVIGALSATSPDTDAFSDVDMSLLDAFADQAAIAVKNARLYEQLLQEQKQTGRLYQSVLEKSNELEAILRGIGDGVIVTDPNLRLLMMNPVAARIFRIVEAPRQGVRLPEIVSDENLLTLTQDTLTDVDVPLIREIPLAEEGDRVRIYQALASTVHGADNLVRGVVIVMRDITAQKEIEQTKSDFLSVVSHELRTPLHSIKGFVDIILMGKTGEINELQRDFLGTVKESTTSLQRLIDDLLEFSRMEAGQIKLKPELVSLRDIAEGVVERLGPLADESGLTLRNEIPEELVPIEADPMRIEQVLTNLSSNALKFTPEGGSVTISCEDMGAEMMVSVEDTGIGIPAEEQARIFQRFYQVDGSVTRSYRGAGLGLTICKFIVEYHHGSIWVESVEGQGSAFHFQLPKELPKDDALVIDFTTPARRA